MFERYTDLARYVLILAREEARDLSDREINTGHLLLGLVREVDGVASEVLRSMGVTLEAARSQVADIIVDADNPSPSERIPHSRRAKRVLGAGFRESVALGHGENGTGHLLLGLLREGSGVGVQVLGRLGVDAADARARVVQLLPERSETSGIERFATRPHPDPDDSQTVLGPNEIREYPFESARALADAFGRPIHAPTAWPDSASPATYVIASGQGRREPTYKIRPLRRGAPVLLGAIGSVRQRIGGGQPPRYELSDPIGVTVEGRAASRVSAAVTAPPGGTCGTPRASVHAIAVPDGRGKALVYVVLADEGTVSEPEITQMIGSIRPAGLPQRCDPSGRAVGSWC